MRERETDRQTDNERQRERRGCWVCDQRSSITVFTVRNVLLLSLSLTFSAERESEREGGGGGYCDKEILRARDIRFGKE